EAPVYPGTCSSRSVADADTLGDRAFAWRFRAAPLTPTPLPVPLAKAASFGRGFAKASSFDYAAGELGEGWPFIDLFRGPTEVDHYMWGGDFVIWKTATTPAYQLVLVLDI